MKKMNISKVCYAISAVLVLGFMIHTIVDYNRYYNGNTLNSAPFYLWVVVNAVCLIVPAIIALVVGIVVRKKNKPICKPIFPSDS